LKIIVVLDFLKTINMRFSILIFLIISFSFYAKSQNDSIVSTNSTERVTGLKAGTIFVGASSNFSVTKNSPISSLNQTINTIMFSPKLGVFIGKGVLLGSEYQLYRSKREIPFISNYQYNSSRKYVDNEHLVSIFVRYYFGSWKLKPFLEVSGGIGKYKSTSEEKVHGSNITYNEEFNSDIKEWKLSAGLSYFITKRVSIDGIVGFGETKGDKSYTNQFVRANFGFSLFF